LVEVVEPNPSGNGLVSASGSLVTKYAYNTLGNLIETEQGAQHRYFAYDSLGRLTRQKLAEQTATLNDAGVYVGAGQTGANWGEAFVYDNRSNLVQRTDPRGVKTIFSYQVSGADDPLNRLQSVTYDLSGPRDTSIPISLAATVSYEYMTTGDKTRLFRVTAVGVSTETYVYDSQSRVSDYTLTLTSRPAYPFVTSYIYDSLDRVVDVRYPAQWGQLNEPRKLVHHDYDVASRLTGLTVDGNVQASDINYNSSSQTTQLKVGAVGANQITETYSYDNQTGLLTNQKAQRSGSNLLDLSYEYLRSGTTSNRTGHLTKLINNLDQNKNRNYEYDALGRLTQATGGNNLWTQNYQYDRYGNRTSVTASGNAANGSPIPRDGLASLSFNTQTNRINSSGWEYDVAGNQTRALAQDGVNWNRFEYDAANRLVKVKDDAGNTIQSFVYGPTNARLITQDGNEQSNNRTYYVGANGTVLAEYVENASLPNTPQWSKSYTFLGDRLLSTLTPNGQSAEAIQYHHPDRLGTRLITNASDTSVVEQVTLPFGRALNEESTGSTNRRFTSYDRSTVTGLDYAVNRTYDAQQGRFTQVDPIGMRATSLSDPQSLNLYSYCGNDPVNHVDSDGLFFKALAKIFKIINKILKWVAIAITVAATVLAVFVSPGASWAFLQLLGGLLGKLSLSRLEFDIKGLHLSK
jgi:RHS repeat-associated protein